MVKSVYLAALLLTGSVFSVPIVGPQIDLTLRIAKPEKTCHCETVSRITHLERSWPIETPDSKLWTTKESCTDYCVWKLGRREERRRVDSIVRGRAFLMGQPGAYSERSERELRHELD